MRKKILTIVFAAAMPPAIVFASLFGIQYNSATTNNPPVVPVGSTLSGSLSGLDSGITNAAGKTVEQRAVGVSQPPTATLTNIDGLLYGKQPATAVLTNLSAGFLSAPTNTAAFTTVTNDLVTGAWTLMRNQRGTLEVCVMATGNTGGVAYSNAVSGIQRTFFASTTATNMITIRFQPNSLIAATNATVVPNTTSINYE